MLWLVAVIALVYLLYRWSLPDTSKWKSKGVKFVKPYPFFGSYPRSLLGQKPIIDAFRAVYDDLKEYDMAVYYVMKSPALLINDPELIREITVKNFDHFVDRMVVKEVVEVHKEIDKMLTTLCGEEWKAMRAGLSPAFTTGKLKTIVGAMTKTGPAMNHYLGRLLSNDGSNGVVEMRDAFGRYTMGVIAHAVYGVDAKVFEEKESEFVTNARAIQSKITARMFFAMVVYMLVPRLAVALKIRFGPKRPWEFFEKVTKVLMSQRQEKNLKPNDMLQLFVNLRNKGEETQTTEASDDQFEADAKLNVKVDLKSVMNEDGIIQSSVLFLIAGFDTTANTLSLVSYFLAVHPEIQSKAREEADALAEDLGDDVQLSYESIARLEYIDMVLSETLRMTPIASVLERKCTKDATLSNGVKVEEGTRVQFSVIGLHMDPKYWNDPETFDPERFNKENKKRINPYVYMPFGVGPRNCIGMRFALMEVKVAVFHLLRSFCLEPSEKTVIPPKFDVKIPLTAIEGGNFLKLVPRNV